MSVLVCYRTCLLSTLYFDYYDWEFVLTADVGEGEKLVAVSWIDTGARVGSRSKILYILLQCKFHSWQVLEILFLRPMYHTTEIHDCWRNGECPTERNCVTAEWLCGNLSYSQEEDPCFAYPQLFFCPGDDSKTGLTAFGKVTARPPYEEFPGRACDGLVAITKSGLVR